MCGICGIVSLDHSPIDPTVLGRMTDIVRHRGPDGQGYLLGKYQAGQWSAIESATLSGQPANQYQIGLGHRRLAILDLSPAGHQPMPSPDKQYWIVHNGEVYNYIELRDELVNLGYRFQSGTDTEVILAAYQAWGADCVRHFNGMWAFAILDIKNNRLFCSRDRAGVKPFYYYYDGRVFLFGSEIKQLLAHPAVPKRINDGILFDYLVYALLDHSDQTFYDGIKQLPAAHYLEVPLNRADGWIPQPVRYWNIDLTRKITGCTDAQYAERFRELFEDSIRLRLRSDVPIGSCLSGGLDSSGIVSIVNKLLRQAGKSELQKTFSSCFANPRFDERPFIEKVIQFTQVQPHYVFPSEQKLLEELSKLIWHQDEPFGSTSIYAQWNVFRLAKENGVTVMLDGQGGDELLAGYRTYTGVYFLQLLLNGQLAKSAYEISRYYSLAGYSLRRAIQHILTTYRRGLFRLFNMKAQRRPGWLNSDFWEKGRTFSPYHQSLTKPGTSGGSRLDQKLYEMFVQSNLTSLLHYEDRNSMAFSIESRVPFLDYRLVEFMFATPDDQKIRHGWAKYLYRRAMKGLLPEEVRWRRDKMGFVTPEKVWLKTTARSAFEQIIRQPAENDPIFNSSALRANFQAVADGQVSFSFTPWRWINTIAWREIIQS